MIEKKIFKDQFKRAEELYNFQKLPGSFTGGKGNLAGAIGEIVIYDFFYSGGRDVKHEGTKDFDLLIDEYKVDVKTKRRNVKPKPNYLCSVADWNTTQKCDFYFFVSLNLIYKKAYLMGYISPADFYEKAFFLKKGESDGQGTGYKAPADCYNLRYSELNDFKVI